ncbi:Nsg1p NDAI_0B04510 [Naumovozyma dairenensis CBS 421]|uniref:Uncharacterized protein n=1 Tax=Naumovozyma dairenensis (strain ATCC 10597 / BCRC 20456 / CBS 421 / NBRC 0211 / NRRL Y-12639) TaxID=1071378 RepID=G0W6S5_NAUDC|nr:hypothetical protein NDAI_0B04510 [Naumovozyma dairenensis CBS 421]CCD23486.1 hypothetical protein NDAI_0B04510 [Naumovozyma dairenensis CBS 421]
MGKKSKKKTTSSTSSLGGSTGDKQPKQQQNIKKMRSTDSMVNLTKPALASFYSTDIIKDTEDKASSLYKRSNLEKLKKKWAKSHGKSINDDDYDDDEVDEYYNDDLDFIKQRKERDFARFLRDEEFNKKWYIRSINLIYSGSVLFICGLLFGELSKFLFDNHDLQKGGLSIVFKNLVQLLDKIITVSKVTEYIGFGIQGIILGVILKISDNIFRPSKEKTGINRKNSFRSIIRLVNAMLGISLGVRRLPWTSSNQGSILWLLLNVIVWLFFDGSLSFLMSGIVQTLFIAFFYYNRFDHMSQLLYLINFHFLGMLFFGKLQRYLFKRL